jgi:tetratricopeptide (TPR) repeat protein
MRIAALIAFTAFALSAVHAGATERFHPVAPDYVVLRVPARAQNDPITLLEQQRSRAPEDQRIAAELAARYVERARVQREARYFGRAEMLLQPWVARPDALVATLRVQADILQNRHDFSGALALLDTAVSREPRDISVRLMRASVKVVQGRAGDARGDCGAVLAGGNSVAGTVCLAQVLGDTGKLSQAEALLNSVLARGAALPAEVRGWALWLQADFADRRGDASTALALLREALRAEPFNEGIRSALCDLLIARGDLRGAFVLVDLPAPSTGLLARRAHIQKLLGDSTGLRVTQAQIADLLGLASRRGERPHLREEALLALDVEGDASKALQLARANFAQQRETIDARLLVRAARAAGDRDSLAEVTRWLHDTGFEDHELAGIRT